MNSVSRPGRLADNGALQVVHRKWCLFVGFVWRAVLWVIISPEIRRANFFPRGTRQIQGLLKAVGLNYQLGNLTPLLLISG